MEITDRATVLRDGKVAATIDTRAATKADFIEAIVGRKLAAMTPPAPPAARGPSHAVVHNLSGGTIEGFSLDLAAGEVVGVTGLIGSGYDEIPYLIYGAREARGGTLDIGGRGVTSARSSRATRFATGSCSCPPIGPTRASSARFPSLTTSPCPRLLRGSDDGCCAGAR